MRPSKAWILAILLASCRSKGQRRADPAPDAAVELAAADAAVAQPAPAEPLTALVAGGGTTCAIRAGGRVLCWGANAHGQLGDGTTSDRSRPTEVPGLEDVVELALSPDSDWATACARLRDGSVRCWGDDQAGQVGDGNAGTGPRVVPQAVAGVKDAARLELRRGRSCAITSQGDVLCWGDVDARGHWGDGKARSRGVATPVEGLASVAALAGSCALLAGGSVVCMDERRALRPVRLGLEPIVELAAGVDAHCARTEKGRVSCWGSNEACRLGKNFDELQSSTAPIAMKTVDDARALAIPDGACAVTAGGTLVCQGGSNADPSAAGHCGGGPKPVAHGLGSVLALAMTSVADCALRDDGKVACWSPALTRTARAPAAKLLELGGVFVLAAGTSHVCALAHGGAVHCWGQNEHGQLGDGSVSDHAEPVAVGF